jgi:para-aminobenzoate synthetase/4-amino-4-deoxychorismate lyase
MRDSALYFQMTFSAEKARLSLKRAASRWRRRARRVRLLLDAAGRLRVESAVLSQSQHGPWRLAPAAEPVNAADVFLYHKTTNRGVYERAARGRPDFDDVVLYNERGEITETTIGNIVAELNGRLLTPPVRCGLLAGVYRGHLIRKGIIGEEALTLEDLKRARKLWVINSVRKWMPAELAG